MRLRIVQAIFLGVLVSALHASLAQASASSLTGSQTCSGSGVDLTLAWINSSSAVVRQYIDVSTENSGWAPGTFVSSGPLAASANSATLNSLTLGMHYYVRVNQQLTSGAWDPSETFALFTSSCAAATIPSTGTGGGLGSLNAWLQSIGVLSQPSVDSFAHSAIASYQQPPLAPILVQAYPSFPAYVIPPCEGSVSDCTALFILSGPQPTTPIAGSGNGGNNRCVSAYVEIDSCTNSRKNCTELKAMGIGIVRIYDPNVDPWNLDQGGVRGIGCEANAG